MASSASAILAQGFVEERRAESMRGGEVRALRERGQRAQCGLGPPLVDVQLNQIESSVTGSNMGLSAPRSEASERARGCRARARVPLGRREPRPSPDGRPRRGEARAPPSRGRPPRCRPEPDEGRSRDRSRAANAPRPGPIPPARHGPGRVRPDLGPAGRPPRTGSARAPDPPRRPPRGRPPGAGGAGPGLPRAKALKGFRLAAAAKLAYAWSVRPISSQMSPR